MAERHDKSRHFQTFQAPLQSGARTEYGTKLSSTDLPSYTDRATAYHKWREEAGNTPLAFEGKTYCVKALGFSRGWFEVCCYLTSNTTPAHSTPSEGKSYGMPEFFSQSIAGVFRQMSE
jgi:hypothetical protein